ncbi:MAG: TonB-dependent receptor [Terriglobia bacterium]
MRREVWIRLASCLALLAGFSSSVWAQQFQGSFAGTVTDPSGGVVPEVTVTAVEVDKGFSRRVVTLGDGSYEIPLLPPGRYQLSAEKAGFEKTTQGPIELAVNAHLNIGFQLKVGSQTTTVTVEARPPVLDTQTSSVGTTVEQEKVSQLPLNGRHFLELTLFTPGVVPGTGGSENSERGGAINVNGMRESMNSFWLDGMDNTSIGVGQYVIAPPVDSVQEFRMETGVYEAKFGANAGAQINVVTKSGSNRFRGTVHEFLRNGSLDARNFFEPFVPHFVRNQFGGTVGGPIKLPGYDGHDRSFFFLAYEGLRERRAFFNRARVPTLAERDGDFSDLLAPECSQKALLIDPFALLGGVVQPLPDNALPFLDPVGKALADLYPPPNIPSAKCGDANFTIPQTRKIDVDASVLRLDHRWGNKDSLFYRHNVNFDRSFLPSGGVPGFGKRTHDGYQMAGLDWTHAFSPTLINEAKIAYNRWQLRWSNEDQGRMIAQELGIKGAPTAYRQSGVPNMEFAGYDGMGAGTNVPQAGAVNTFEYADTLTHVHGNHSLAYGFDIRSINRGNFYIDTSIRNEFHFTGMVTAGLGNLSAADLGLPSDYVLGNGLADALLGLPTYWLQGFSVYISGAGSEYDFFVQDTWKVRRNFVLNLGLRYEYNSPITDKYDHLGSFDFNKGLVMMAGRDNVTLINFDPATGLYVPVGTENLGSTSQNRALNRPDRNNWAPRIGFAWQPFGDTKTVVRGGYGIFYDQTFGDVYLSSKASNPPFVRVGLGTLEEALPLIMTGQLAIGTGEVIQNALVPPTVGPLFPVISPFQLDFRDAFIQQWGFNIQRELPGSWLLDVGYLGTRGLRLPRITDPNQPNPDPVNQTTARRFPTFSNFSYYESSGSSSYHALQVKAERHFSRGLAFVAGYTFSKSLDTNSTIFGTDRNSNSPQNSRDLAAEKALSDYDFRHRLSLAYVYELPFGSKLWRSENRTLNYLTEGWQLSGIIALQSGPPFTPQISGDISHTEENQDRPSIARAPYYFYPAHKTPDHWVLADSFTVPAPYTFGNAGRNILTGPGLANWDFSLIRRFRLTESKTLEFRAEMFNIFNRPNFEVPNRDLASASFGKIFNTVQSIAGLASGGPGDPRETQFGLKLIW